MRYYEIKAEIERLQELLKTTFPTLEEVQPGDEIEYGCVVIERYSKTLFHNERLLVAAPQETIVCCEWTPEFKPVFNKLKERGFTPSDWLIPSVDQLKLAYTNAEKHFSTDVYWSSEEANSTKADIVDFLYGYQDSYRKTDKFFVRAFRFIEL